MDYLLFYSYGLCFAVSSACSFMDIIEGYSVYYLKYGFKYKIAFAAVNGAVSLVILSVLWNTSLLIAFSPLLKGVYVAFAYQALIKSKFLISADIRTPDLVYQKLCHIFRELIEEESEKDRDKSKDDLVEKYSLDELSEILENLIENDSKLSSNIKEKSKRLRFVKDVIDNPHVKERQKQKSLAKAIIEHYPSRVSGLLKPEKK
jgi:hypothetical protein